MSFGSPYTTLPDFEYHKVSSVEEVTRLLKEFGDEAEVMAGGVGLMAFMKERLLSPAHLIDVKDVKELRQIVYTRGKGLSVGAAITYEEVAANQDVRARFQALHEAAVRTADPMIRARATLVGNLCEAIPWVDSPPVLMALDASVEIAGAGGRRTLPVGGFIKGPVEVDLGSDEFVTRIDVPEPSQGSRSAFEKFTGGSEFALASVAVSLASGNGKRKAKVVFGSVNSMPVRCGEAEQVLQDSELSQSSIRKAAEVAAEKVECVSDVLASVEYRKHLVRVITIKALGRLLRA
ncbi:MAG: xanthine dehydrogenase family protein subunit M [Nitrososphaerota archaeon]|nr:xanthine dehydrogenase family protein subunit M [Nitrososphaerota archaeon]